MTTTDARALTAALALLTRAIGDTAAGQMQNAQRDPDADRKLPPEVVARMGADAALEKQYRERRFGYDDGAIQDKGRRAPQGGGVDNRERKFGFQADVGKNVGGKIGGAMNLIGAKFAMIMGPMAILSQVLSANTSGFQILGSAVKLLAATIGPILLPVIAVLAAGFVDVADRMWEDMAPALEGFYELVVGALLPAIAAIVDAFEAGADFFNRQIEALTPTERTHEESIDMVKQMRGAGYDDAAIEAAGFGDTLRAMEAAERNGGRPVDPRNPTGRGDYDDPTASATAGTAGDYGDAAETTPEYDAEVAAQRKKFREDNIREAERGGPRSRTGEAFSEVVREMRASFGPKAQFSGISQLSRSAQLAAINQSPFEAKMLDRMTKALEALERIDSNTGRGGVAH